MNNITYKRIAAFFIDLLIVSLVSGLLSNIRVLNPYIKQYEKAADKYTQYYEKMTESTQEMTYENLFNDEFINSFYDLSKYGISYVVIEFVVTILYFTLFPYFNKNKTIGKDLVHITTEDASFGKLLLKSFLIPMSTSLLLYNGIGSIILVLSIFILSKKVYFYFYIIFSFVMAVFCYADIIFMFARSDHRSLHDIITKTNVINM